MERPTLERESVQGVFSLQKLVVMIVQWLHALRRAPEPVGPLVESISVRTRHLDMAQDADITRTLLFSNRGYGCRGCNGGGWTR